MKISKGPAKSLADPLDNEFIVVETRQMAM